MVVADLVGAFQDALPEFVVSCEATDDGRWLTFLKDGIRVYTFVPGDPRIWIFLGFDDQVRFAWARKKAVWDAVRARQKGGNA